jgi:rubrerythrin
MTSNQTSVMDVLKLAIRREIESQQLYRSLADRVAQDAARYAFTVLFHQELEHQQILEKYLNGGYTQGILNLRQVIDYKIAESLDQPVITPEMPLPDIFLLAADREKKAHEFYQQLAGIHPPGEIRSLFGKLASEELGHKQKVEQMYTEVAFPQTDGG